MKISNNLDRTFEVFKKFNQNFYASRTYRIAESNILIFYFNKQIYDLLSKALCHLENKTSEIDLTIYAVSNDAYPQSRPQISEDLVSLEKVSREEKPQIFFIEDPSNILSYQRQNGINEVSILNTSSREAVFWLDDLKQYKSEVLASPFRTIFSWHFLRNNKILIHASAVGTEKGGIIFIGHGGSGKSSCSLAALEANLKFAADDAVVISEDLKVYSLYNTIRLREDDLIKFNFDPKAGYKCEDHKFNFYLAETRSSDLVNSFPLKVIVAPNIKQLGVNQPDFNQNTSRFEIIKSIEALTILAPSSLMHIPGYKAEALKLLAKIVNTTPKKYRYSINQFSSISRDLGSIFNFKQSD